MLAAWPTSCSLLHPLGPCFSFPRGPLFFFFFSLWAFVSGPRHRVPRVHTCTDHAFRLLLPLAFTMIQSDPGATQDGGR